MPVDFLRVAPMSSTVAFLISGDATVAVNRLDRWTPDHGGTIEARTIPGSVSQPVGLAHDGRGTLFLTASDNTWFQFDEAGRMRLGPMAGLSQSALSAGADGTVVAAVSSQALLLVAGSTTPVPLTTFPSPPEVFAVASRQRMVMLSQGSIHTFLDGSWTEEVKSSRDLTWTGAGPPPMAASSSSAMIVGVGNMLAIRDETTQHWTLGPAPLHGGQAARAVAARGSRLFVVGDGGLVYASDQGGWCQILSGADRTLDDVALSPDRSLLFASSRSIQAMLPRVVAIDLPP
jgi:hypothetical protein